MIQVVTVMELSDKLQYQKAMIVSGKEATGLCFDLFELVPYVDPPDAHRITDTAAQAVYGMLLQKNVP